MLTMYVLILGIVIAKIYVLNEEEWGRKLLKETKKVLNRINFLRSKMNRLIDKKESILDSEILLISQLLDEAIIEYEGIKKKNNLLKL